MPEGEEKHLEMAHVIVRRSGTRYVAEIADRDLRAEADSAVEALRRMRELLEARVNNPSTVPTASE